MKNISLLAIVLSMLLIPATSLAQGSKSITLRTPNGGENIKIGEQIDVSWEMNGLVDPTLKAVLHRFDGNSSTPVESTQIYSANKGSMIGSTTGSFGNEAYPGTTPSNKYKLEISYVDSNGDTGSDWSDNYFTISQESSASAHTEGTNVLGSNGTVYRVVGNGLSPYTSAGAFLSYKFNTWSGVVTANSADLNLSISSTFIAPRNGSLINDKGTVYLITGGLRAGFANEAAFKGMGYSYSNVYPGDTSFMQSLAPINSSDQIHPNGTLINDNGTLYVMQNGYRVGFPSMAVLDSWGYWTTDAVPVNSYDRQAQQSGVMSTRMVNQMNI